MIKFHRFKLNNGLTVLFHQDNTTPLAVVNTIYDVGARDEDEQRTGFAHLFEHLMFGGSVNIPEFDTPLQRAGGENNAFTSNDVTNYYNILPAQNIETALWLESDRMLSLAFTEKSLKVQKNVVIEEFKQQYLNQPYGDVWLHLRPLAYSSHPYKWATIGKDTESIEYAEMEEVKAFFFKYYCPANAILGISGNFQLAKVKSLVNKWYKDIPSGQKHFRNLPIEPAQMEYREKTIERDVPAKAFYYAFKMVDRLHPDFFVCDFLSDALGRDKSSRLYVKLKKNKNLVVEINAYITGSNDDGLLIISGKLNESVTFEQLDDALWQVLTPLKDEAMEPDEFFRILNKIRTAREFQDQGILNKTMKLCVHELLGDANMVNEENGHYQKITAADVNRVANSVFRKENCSLLKVLPKNE